MQGGWQNRLALGLKSSLPNEVDWAFNKLVKLSFQHYFFIGFIPGLFDALIEHLDGFFQGLKVSTNPAAFETVLAENSTLPPLSEVAMFTSKERKVFYC